MRVKILCPNAGCGASYSVEDRRLGREARCKRCGRRFALVPETQVNGSSTAPFDNGLAPTDPRGFNGLPPRFGRYRVIRLIGRGGMGAVYLAEDTELQRRVALKTPHQDPNASPELRERFLREARAAAQFHHPNFCPIHDIGEVDGVPYLTMAFLEGRTLASMIEPGQPWPQRRAAEFARQLATALAEAHRRGVVHRDLKPANVMVEDRGGLVLMDFGLARRIDAGDTAFTANGVILGTPAYMSPEQAEADHDAVGPRSDIYSLGVILYELLTGRQPFEGSTAKILGQIACNDPPPPSTFHPEIDPRLGSICLKAIARRPEDRHPSMDEFAREIDAWLQPDAHAARGPAGPTTVLDTPEVPKAKAPPERRPRGFRLSVHAWGFKLTLAVVGSVMLLASGLLVLERYQAQSEAPSFKPRAPGSLDPGLLTQQSPRNSGLDQTALAPAPIAAEVLPEITNSVGMRLKLIPTGVFLMGSDDSDGEANANERPRHRVQIARPFYLGIHEVTQAQYEKVMGINPSHFSAGVNASERPVESVSWEDAMSFCDKLSAKEGLKPYVRSGGVSNLGNTGYRLPTEEEWEYACRAGTSTRFGFGGRDGDADLGLYAWCHDGLFDERSANITHPVGRKLPNAFGLFDMHGNVSEWCLDYFHGDYSGRPTEAKYRIHRGGAWGNYPVHCRSANRGYAVPWERRPYLGFRVARDAR